MHVPLTIGDFLERAALVHGADRVAVVDEPGVAGSLGAITYGEMHDRARGMALALDAMGVAHGERVAIVEPELGPLPHLVLRRERLRARARARSTSGSTPRRSPTSSSTPGPRCCSSTPSSRTVPGGVSAKVRSLDGDEDAELFAPGRRRCRPRRAGTPTRTPRARSTTPRAPRPAPRGCSSPTGTAGSTPPMLRVAHHRHRSRRAAAHPAHVPLQRLGHALRGDRPWAAATSCCARSTARRSCPHRAPRG